MRQIKIKGLGKLNIYGTGEGDVVVLEKDENSYFMGASKECTQDFFDRIYDENGPFWRLYANAGFAVRPQQTKYAVYVGNALYFRKSVEERYMYNAGIEKDYAIKNNYLIRKTKWDLRNLIYLLTLPFDEARQFVNMIKFSFYANEMIRGYERSYRSAIEFYNFYSSEGNIYDPAKTAKEAMERAVEMMEYSIAAFICNKYGIKLKHSKYIDECELEKLSTYIETNNTMAILDEFEFYSLNPYDISVPRLFEDDFRINKFSGFKVPGDNSLRWRENVKFIVARYMHIMRMCYKLIGDNSKMGDLIFYLKINELSKIDPDAEGSVRDLIDVALKRKNDLETIRNIGLPSVLVYKNEKYYEKAGIDLADKSKNRLNAISVSSKKSVSGPIVNINSMGDYEKCAEGSIILSKTLSPNLVILFKKAAGIIAESGGSLCHAAIIAREMNLPCLIQLKTKNGIPDGSIVRLDGKNATVTILDAEKKAEKETTHNELNKASAELETARKNPDQSVHERIVLNKGQKVDFYMLSGGKLQSKSAGNKAANLSEIYSHFNVPDGFVIDSEYFRKLNGFERIGSIVREINKANASEIAKLEEHYNVLKNEFSNIEFSRKLADELGLFYEKLASRLVAARSSSSSEDSAKASFAGQFDSYINIGDINNLEYAIKSCWASFYSPRSVVYRKENRIKNDSANMAILVQKMIEAKYSGIAFSKDIMNDNAMSIEVIPGTCEKLASGEVSPNVYIIERESMSVLKVNANFDFDDNLVTGLATEVLKLENYFKAPQDVEWCIDNENKIWIIQTRPITSACKIK
ncbi:MAG: PEP/pyruvate-binding domain-containing protein [Candidatus Paceibacterota bacterium]